jgi:signal transduction histidine kinase/CheY-like chemotaxis protein
MQAVDEKTALQENVLELRDDSFKIILLLTAVVAWIWFSWAVWPEDSYSLYRSDAWAISGLLLVVVGLSYAVRSRWSVYLASYLFIGGLVVAITGALLVLKSIEVGYLYVLPVIFCSVLFGQYELLGAAAAAGSLTLFAGLVEPALQTPGVVALLITIGLTTITILIATNNLQKALAWALNGYLEAHKNELVARERKATLERALKNLDTAMAKLERANAMLTQARNEAEEARRVKQQFAQTISHELRTPLNLIAGFTETMIKSPEYYGAPLPPLYLRDLSVVYRNACHLQNLVNDVLDLARLESAYLSLELEELDLCDVIEDAISTARGLVEGRGLALNTTIAPNLPLVWGDAVRLKQVLLNLLNNAARFTEQGGVTVRAEAQGDAVLVSVTDTGIGIPEENIADIFESFRQLENPMQRRTSGAGLGLAISQQLIGLHGGQIWVESEVGVGSRFFFSLPTGRVETLDVDRSLEDMTLRLGVAERSEHAVLIVTRSPSAAALLARTLANHRTLVVSDLDQARAASQQVIPQMIIIDTGTENLDEVDLHLFAEDLPRTVIITCPLPGEEPLRKRLSVEGYLIKPVTHESLWDVLRRFSDDLNKVLVVDNDQDFARLLGRMLSNPVRDYHVTYAYSGREALGMIRRSKPEIMLLDLNLPDIDGLEVIHKIRAAPIFADMRIVVITGYEEIDLSNLLAGTICIARGQGLTPTEIVNWIKAGLHNGSPAV